MKNKLFMLLGAAFLLGSTVTFTSCINGVDDEYLELANTNTGGGNDEEEEEGPELPDLNGDYFAGGDFELAMTYNGEELTGKKVNVVADELNQTAIITLAGVDQDLSAMLGGLLPFQFETFSPIPGVKELTIPNVTLYNSSTGGYAFEGDYFDPTYTFGYTGTIEDGKMNIKLIHQLANQTLAGLWNLAPAVEVGDVENYAPLWLDWDSTVRVDLGMIMSFISLKQPINGVFALLAGGVSSTVMQQIIGIKIGVEPLILNLLKGITAESGGNIFATYSYSGDLTVPAWSSEMPHNALRYYFDPEQPDSKIRLEINPDFLVGLIGGLLNPAPAAATQTRAADPEVTKEIGRQLIAMLTPLLQEGIPCDYVLEGNNLSINIDGVVLRDILEKLFELANDEVAKPIVEEFVNSSLGSFGPNIMGLLRTAPYALQYRENNPDEYDKEGKPLNGSEEKCGYVKLGLRFVRG